MSSNPPERLTMIALGIRGDAPVDPDQPALVDGVHCRWAPAQELGFPWHGFYLFRRETVPTRPRCLKKELAERPPQSGKNLQVVTAIGTLSSAKPLVFTDDFPETGIVEADLGAPVRFELPEGVETTRVDLKIGFRETPRLVRTCVDFRRLPPGSGPTPRTEQGAVFTVQPVSVVTQAPDAAIEQWADVSPGLEFTTPVAVTYRLDIALPCRATKVDLFLSSQSAIVVHAFETGGASAGVQSFFTRLLREETVTFSGKAIDRITIESTAVDATLLHEVCWECPVLGGGVTLGPEIRVDFTGHGLQEFPNPIVDQGVTFEARENDQKATLAWFRGVGGTGKTGMWIRPQVDIHLPCATSRAELLVFGVDEVPLEIKAFNQAGVMVDRVVIPRTGEATAVVAGSGITRIRLDALMADALLHTLTFRCGAPATQQVTVRAFAGERGRAQILETIVSGEAGQVVPTSFTTGILSPITAIEIDSAKAALVELCYLPTRQSAQFGWEEVPGFQYPLCLPVDEDDYPCPTKPGDPDAARNLALSRVTYPRPQSREQGFWKLHEELVLLVRGGPDGGPMTDRVHPRLPGNSESPVTQESPSLPNLKPLDLVCLASLQPAYAQMLGLYFVDQDVPPGVAYDYLILADTTGILGGSAKTALEWVAQGVESTEVHSDLVLDRRAEPRPSIASPRDARAYALPGAAARQVDGTLPDVAGNVGLWWPLPPDVQQEEPDRIVFHDVRRAFFGPTRPGAAPDASQYQRVPRLESILISEPDPPPEPRPPDSRGSDWPPLTIPIHTVDGNLAEGWYSYRLIGQDLFGRRSAAGPPAEWYQWDPTHISIDPFAVRLVDKHPPPTPLGVEAWALDPEDRWLFDDAAYRKWRANKPQKLIGLRVRWRWTLLQQIQAPDTREFRLYWQPGRWNAILANIEQVTGIPDEQSQVELDIADAHAANDLAGARLRVGNADFAILGSDPGTRLRLRVKNIGAHDEVRPEQGKGCTVAIPAGHKLFIDTSVPKSWARRLAIAQYDPPLAIVIDPSKDAGGQPLTNEVFKDPIIVNGNIVHLPHDVDLSGIQPWIDHLWLQDQNKTEQTLRILRFDTTLRTITLETPVTLVPAKWIIGRPAREYEVFLDAPDVGANFPFEPTLPDPVVYAQVAVSAADDKTHAVDTWPGQDLGNRTGNESPLSPSATVYRVRHKIPDPPQLPDLGDRLFATPADWRDRSFTTFRFLRQDHLRIHILRALDDTLFQRDWIIRETRAKLDPVLDPTADKAKVEHLAFFPDWKKEESPLPARRQAAAELINKLTTGAAYSTLTDDAWDVLALLPGNERQPDRTALEARDRLMRRLRGPGVKRDDAALAGSFLQAWNDATRDAILADLEKITAPESYLQLSDNTLRFLAVLPGNDTAFTQVTLEPLEMSAPTLRDERRADDDADYTPTDTNVRAYTDTLPGRATNRYLYRAAFVDRAQNIGSLSLVGPPVYLHKVEPPRAPVITRVVGGDRKITIEWASNREPDLAEYRLYRADSDEQTRDVRLMTRVHTSTVTEQDPLKRVAAVAYQDGPVVARITLRYAVTAVDTSGNESRPSRLVSGVAYDHAPPSPPVWLRSEWIKVDATGLEHPLTDQSPGLTPAVALSLSVSTGDLSILVERLGVRWNSLTPWSEPAFDAAAQVWRLSHIDRHVRPDSDHSYRVRLVNRAGLLLESELRIVPQP